VCQPGVGWTEINETLKEKGIPLFFPVRGKPDAVLVFNARHSSIRVPRRLLVACLARAAPEVSAILTVLPHSLISPSAIANAVRYGTAKGEWFLNAVSIL
jgi:D-lactate dehydrogenase (cytochrome)